MNKRDLARLSRLTCAACEKPLALKRILVGSKHCSKTCARTAAMRRYRDTLK